MRARRATDAPPATEASGGIHFPCLDAYRAIGMTMVLAIHAGYATGYIPRAASPDANAVQQVLGPLLARFDVALPMFFVLSGFLIYRPFAVRYLEGSTNPGLRTFYRRRAFRIFPAYWVALVGLAVVSWLSGAFDLGITTVGSWIGNGLVLPAVGVPVDRCVDGACGTGYGITQAWSIGVEVVFYALLPLWARAAHAGLRRLWPHSGVGALLAGCAVLWLTGNAFRLLVVLGEPSWTGQSLLWLPMYLDFLAIGMGFAAASAALAGRQRLPAPLQWAGAHPVACWAMAGLVLVLVAQMDPPSEPFLLEGAEYLPRQLGYGLIAGLWLVPCMFGDQSAGRLRAVLASRPLAYLGGISLSFYLWHLAFVEQAKAWTVPNYGDLEGLAVFQGNPAVVTALAFVLSFIVASVIYRFVELPFLRRKGRHSKAPL